MATEFPGLTQQQAQQRLLEDGANELTQARRRTWWDRWLDLLAEPMIALLVAAALIYIVLGDLGEGLTLAVFVLAVVGLTLYQEGKSEASIEALRDMTQPSASVSRDGQRVSLPARDVVVGDLLFLSEGDRIAADGQVLWVDNLQVDESLLTGESVAVNKEAGGDAALSHVYGGTHVVRGQALVRVTATGARSEIGRIGTALGSLQTEPTPLHRQTARLVRIIATVALVLCLTLVIVQGLRTGEWLSALLAGIALAMGILPEEYPVVLALFPALGAHRLAREGVLTRRLNAIETLGATTVLCTDKTGTLTENRMQVACLAIGPADQPQWHEMTADSTMGLPESFHDLIEHAVLASAPDPFDPMEQAFHRLGQVVLNHSPHQHEDWTLVQTYALSPQLRALSHVWQTARGDTHVVSTKGAPEAVMSLCHLNAQTQAHWSRAVQRMAGQGLRVLAVARGRAQSGPWPESAHDFEMAWVGLVGLRDPLRAEIPPAMQQARAAGIRVIMITGDYPLTAQVIADQAGMPAGRTLLGDEMDAMSDEALQATLRDTRVCARISPQQNLRFVQCLKANGEIVTMTGDGVNDAPALKAAHVGVAMGQRGTDVAREAADLVLVDDNFASMVRGIRTGRRIFDNLRKSMTYIFAVHIPIAGVALLPMLLSWPPLLLPLHIALLELVIDPACSLAFENEPEDPQVMQRPARDTQAPLLGRREFLDATLQGLVVLAGLWLSYHWSSWSGLIQGCWPLTVESITVEMQRAMVLVSLVAANGVLIAANRSSGPGRWPRSRNTTARWVTLAALSAMLLGIYWPWSAQALQLAALSPQALVVALGCGVAGWPLIMLWRLRRPYINPG